MGNMLETGSQWLANQLKSHAANQVTYVRGLEQVSVQATIGKTEFEKDLLLAEESLGLVGVTPRFFRPAGGLIRPGQLEIVRSRRYVCVLGSAYAFDPYQPPSGAIAWMVNRALAPGAVIVLHDSGGERRETVAALPAIIEGAREKGLRFVTLSEMASPRR